MTVRLGASGGERSESLPSGPDCLEPDVIMGLVQGWLEPDDLRKAEAHIDRCDECRRCVSEFARTSGEPGDEGDLPAARLAADGAEGELTAPFVDAGHTMPIVPRDSTNGYLTSSGAGGAVVEAFLPRGASLGRYVVDGLLGAGGMGVVYAAFDPKLDRKVALKLLRAGAGAGLDARERLLREARAMARLSHPNVVSVYDVDVHEGRLFLAMEYVDGVTLRSWLRREARTPVEVLRALVRAGRGLSAAHAVGVVHRDVKPDNVLVDVRGRVCVTDFGLARAASGARSEAPPEGATGPAGSSGGALAGPAGSLGGPLAGPAGPPGGPLAGATRTGSLIGTPAYMAPEQHKGRLADAKSDQFSFCVMLYEALYRRRPFEGDTFRALADAVTGGKLREPPSLAPVVPRVRKAILRGLSVDPAERFESMDALLEAISGDRGARRRVVAIGGTVAAIAALTAGYRYARPDARPICQGAELKLAGVWDDARKGAVRGAFLATGKPFAADAFRGVERALDKYTGAWATARVDACEATQVRGEQSAELLDLRMACLDDRLKEVAALGEVLSRADAEVVIRAVGAAQSIAPLGPCGDAKALRARVKPPAEPAAAAKVEAQRGELARAQALSEAGKYREALQLVEGVARVADELGYRPLQAEARLQEGRLQLRTGDVKRSEATLERAVTAADAAGDDATRALAYSTLVFSVGALQARHEQVAFFNEQARAALDRLGGDSGIDGLCRGNFAAALRRQGRSDEALREQAASIIALERAFGPESRQVLTGLYGLGNAHLGRRDLDAAAGAFRHYLERSERALGPHHPSVAEGLSGLGTVLLVQAHSAEALPHLERALAIMEGALGPESKTLTPYLDNLGSALGDQGQHKRALAYFERSLALSEKQLGPDHPLLLWPLTGLGEAYLGLGDYPKAIAHLERALERQGTADAAADLAIARFALARALSQSGRDRRRAHTLALAARDAYRSFKNGPLDERNLRRVDEWLERHPQG